MVHRGDDPFERESDEHIFLTIADAYAFMFEYFNKTVIAVNPPQST